MRNLYLHVGVRRVTEQNLGMKLGKGLGWRMGSLQRDDELIGFKGLKEVVRAFFSFILEPLDDR